MRLANGICSSVVAPTRLSSRTRTSCKVQRQPLLCRAAAEIFLFFGLTCPGNRRADLRFGVLRKKHHGKQLSKTYRLPSHSVDDPLFPQLRGFLNQFHFWLQEFKVHLRDILDPTPKVRAEDVILAVSAEEVQTVKADAMSQTMPKVKAAYEILEILSAK